MINPLDFKSIKRSVTLESVLGTTKSSFGGVEKTNIGAAARFIVATGTTPFT